MGKNQTRRPLSITIFHMVITILAALSAFALILVSILAKNHFNTVQTETAAYINCVTDIHALDEASDLLTNKSREFAVTGDVQAVNEYFEVINEKQTREKALENLQTYFVGTNVLTEMQAALKESNRLANIETYQMRLAAQGYGVTLPESIMKITLTDADLALSPAEQIKKALNGLFDETYMSYKEKIDAHTETALAELLAFTEKERNQGSSEMLGAMTAHDIVATVLVLFIILGGWSTHHFVSMPLMRARKSIGENQKIPVSGSSEIQFLSTTYNEMFDEHQKITNALKYEADHDALTGISNRHGYVNQCIALENESLYFVIADIDRFKSINDICGHAAGDGVLLNVAQQLQAAFSGLGYVYRIGGDEFVVMVLGKVDAKALTAKLSQMNHSFAKPNGSLPSFSLSFGAIHKPADMSFEEAYRKADKALYKVKNSGGAGVNVYKEG